MSALHFLVVDGNTADGREAHRARIGLIPGEAYGEALLKHAPAGSRYDVCLPADEGANLPTAAGLADYDGVALTGSALHLWNREPAVLRQIELARAVYKARVPFFGSCWGIQIGAVAAGGDVRRNVAGREVGFARNIALTPEGARHPLLAGRPAAFTAPAIHLDIVTAPPQDCTVLATNSYSAFQALEIRQDGGTFWGVQYHPEFSLTELQAIIRSRAPILSDEGFAKDEAAMIDWCDEIAELDRDRTRLDLAWKHGLDAEVIDDARRTRELANWIAARVRPEASRRGRG
jgi:GMP synthase (glutamine-hydrolysing)